MTTFQIADPTPTLTPTQQTVGGKAQVEGRVTFVVRNTTGRNRSATIRVIPGSDADLPLLTLVGANPTDPTVRSIDFKASQVQNVEVAAAVPLGATARQVSFRIRATLEGESDDDSIDSRPVALDVPAQAVVPPPPRPSRPWWPFVAGAVLLVVVGGIVAWVLWPRAVKVPNYQNVPLQEVAAFFRAQKGKVTGHLVPTYNPGAPSNPMILNIAKAGTTGKVDNYNLTLLFGPPANSPCNNIPMPIVRINCQSGMQGLAMATISQTIQGSYLSF